MLASGERRLLLSCCATMISVRHPLLELVNSLNDGKMDDSATFMPVKLISQVKYKRAATSQTKIPPPGTDCRNCCHSTLSSRNPLISIVEAINCKQVGYRTCVCDDTQM